MATVYLRDFPEDLHYKAKVRAAMDRTTLKDLVVDALEEFLSEEPADAQPEEKMSESGSRMVTEAMQFSEIAISQLTRIRPDDPRRIEALARVRDYIDGQISGKPPKKQGYKKLELL